MSDEAIDILLLILLRELARILHELFLGFRNHHVVLAERNAGLECVMKAERHDLVAEDD
ncbi:hypothetical protein D3C83_232710 [compost metagenome]